MKQGWTKNLIQEVCLVTDYVANGSFKSLKDNVQYNYEKDYAILLRTTDYVKNWKKGFVYVSKDSYEFLKKSSLNIGDIVISSVGNPGITFKVPDLGLPMTLGPNSILVRSLDETNLTHNFIYYLFNSPIGKDLIDSITTGATQSKFNKTNFRNLSIQAPPLEEQKQIVAKLDQCFEAIDKAKENAAKNLENAKELFQSKLNEIFSQKGEDWVEKKLGDVCKLIDSLHKTPSYIKEGGFPMIRVTDIKDGFINFKNARRVNKDVYGEFSKRHIASIGDLVLSRVGSYGIPAIVETDTLFCLGQNTVFLIPLINTYWIYYFLISPNSKQQMDKSASGVAQPTVSLKSIKQINIPIPSLEEQKQIVKILDSLRKQTQSLESKYQQELNSLEELKKSILQKAFEGEL